MATARLYLLPATHVGERVRTVGRPRIINFGVMTIGDDTTLVSVPLRSELDCRYGATLTVGSDCVLNYGLSIGATERITIGNRVEIGPLVMIIDSQFHDLYDRNKRPPSKPVTIEDDVWLGSRVSVMPGVTIGRGSVVGVNAVVTRDVPPWTIVAGIPAKKIGEIDPARFKLCGHDQQEADV